MVEQVDGQLKDSVTKVLEEERWVPALAEGPPVPHSVGLARRWAGPQVPLVSPLLATFQG